MKLYIILNFDETIYYYNVSSKIQQSLVFYYYLKLTAIYFL